MITKRKIKNNKCEIEYCLKKNRRFKNLRLSVHSDGMVVVTAPRFLGLNKIESFILEKIAWLEEKINDLKKQGRVSSADERRQAYLKLKKQAQKIVELKTAHFARKYGFFYNRIAIRDQRTRWGSCSSKGNLNYNYKIVLLPENCIDYIIVHELCHLRELNHGPRFWSLLESILPDYLERISELKKFKVLEI